MIENPPLAQALYRSVEVGQEIPAHLYRAVAEILAYVYKLHERPITALSIHAARRQRETINMAEAAATDGVQAPRILRGGGAAELGVPVAVLAIVMALITPLPPFLLDLLLVVDIMMSVIVMMVAMYITRRSDFNVFPTTLLLLTLYRLAFNVSSARLILLNGNTGTSAAGHVIEAFGSFVVGGNYIIGTVIFLVLIAIQYVVINHGAVRISEVTARFTLDALPGKQMSIDSDLSSGLIDEAEARRRRKQLAAEAEFYGAMDGASRFTQRDAVASILITGINIIAGFLIGVLQHGMELRACARDLHGADHRRRSGDGDSGADDLGLGRPDHHAAGFGRPPGRGFPQADLRQLRNRCCWPAACSSSWPACRACRAFRFCCWAWGSGRRAGGCARGRRQGGGAAAAKPAQRESGRLVARWNPWPSKWASAW